MILVTDAGYHGTGAFSACRTLPLSSSTSSSASAFAAAQPTVIAAPAISAATRKRLTVEQTGIAGPAFVVEPRDRGFHEAVRGQPFKRMTPPKAKTRVRNAARRPSGLFIGKE